MSDGHFDGWIAVDFDGTLVTYDKWIAPTNIGEPIQPMIERVRQWLADGKQVRIFTARVYAPTNDAERQESAALAMLAIQSWCSQQFGKALPVTCVKDFGMIDLWDDRCVQVEKNVGTRMDGQL